MSYYFDIKDTKDDPAPAGTIRLRYKGPLQKPLAIHILTFLVRIVAYSMNLKVKLEDTYYI